MAVVTIGQRVSSRPSSIQILGQSAVPVSGAADTNENVLATIVVPANAMGLNGRLRIWTQWTFTNNANAKTGRVRSSGPAGTQFLNSNYASLASALDFRQIANRNATNSQIANQGTATGGGLGGSSVGVVTATVDTTVETTVVITAQKGLGTDTMTLESYLVELLYGA